MASAKRTKEQKDGLIKTKVLKTDRIFNNVGDWWLRLYYGLYTGYVNSGEFANCDYGDVSNYSDIHDTKVTDSYGTYDYKRKTLGTPLTISQHLKNLVFGEGVEVKFKGDDKQEWFDEWFKYNNFFEKEKNLFEMQIGIGDKTESFYRKGQQVLLNYVNPTRVIVTEYNNAEVTGAIFATFRKVQIDKKTKWLTLLEWHTVREKNIGSEETPIITKDFIITREIYMSNEKYYLDECVVFGTYVHYFGSLLEQEIEENMDTPLFQFTKNPINNSKAPFSPRGQAIYGGKLDTLQVLATVYDGMYFEYLLKQYMVSAPEEAIEEVHNKLGAKDSRRYNPRAGVLVSMGQTGDYNPDWKDFNPEIRNEEFISGINLNLDIVSVSSGLSAGELRFDGKSIATATQVKAERIASYRTTLEYEENLANGWKSLFVKVAKYAKAWGLITWELKEEDITIKFNESDMQDKQQIFTNDIQAVGASIMPKTIFRERHYDLDEEEEARWNELLEKEQQSIFGFDDSNNDDNNDDLDGNSNTED